MTPTRDELLAKPLQDLLDCWLKPICPPPCQVITHIPLKMMVNKHNYGRVLLAHFLGRLRCQWCKQRPARVTITDSILDPVSYPKRCATWDVEVYP